EGFSCQIQSRRLDLYSSPSGGCAATLPAWRGGHNRLVAVIEAQPPAPAWEQAMRQFGARLFEAGPGLVTWVLLLAPAWIPIIFHSSGALFVAVVVLIFDTYWVVRAASVVTGVSITLLRMRRHIK